MNKKLFYVLGVDTQDFVLSNNDEKELWEKIEELQVEKYLIEKKCPKMKYKKINDIKTQININEISLWEEENLPRIQEIQRELAILKEKFKTAIDQNKNVQRQLLQKKILNRNKTAISNGKKVTISDSTLTRTLGLNKNRFNPEICIIRVYYTGIMESLIKNGFVYDGHEYEFFTASAGQTKDKKFVAIRKDLKEKY